MLKGQEGGQAPGCQAKPQLAIKPSSTGASQRRRGIEIKVPSPSNSPFCSTSCQRLKPSVSIYPAQHGDRLQDYPSVLSLWCPRWPLGGAANTFKALFSSSQSSDSLQLQHLSGSMLLRATWDLRKARPRYPVWGGGGGEEFFKSCSGSNTADRIPSSESHPLDRTVKHMWRNGGVNIFYRKANHRSCLSQPLGSQKKKKKGTSSHRGTSPPYLPQEQKSSNMNQGPRNV